MVFTGFSWWDAIDVEDCQLFVCAWTLGKACLYLGNSAQLAVICSLRLVDPAWVEKTGIIDERDFWIIRELSRWSYVLTFRVNLGNRFFIVLRSERLPWFIWPRKWLFAVFNKNVHFCNLAVYMLFDHADILNRLKPLFNGLFPDWVATIVGIFVYRNCPLLLQWVDGLGRFGRYWIVVVDLGCPILIVD